MPSLRLSYTIESAQAALERREVSSLELTQAYLEQIRGLNGVFNAYITVLEEEARQDAKRSDERRERGEMRGPLDGVPLALKDNICVEGESTTAGSRILSNYLAPYDATVTKRLKQAGAVILGKTNMDEFAMGSSTEHSAYGPTKHPADPTRVPGGSSGGSACAVAADLCVAALGSDTGGSIRQPAAFCGLVGLKPTYGRVSRFGLIAMASSLDQIGPLTKSAADASLLMQLIQGQDAQDQTTASTHSWSQTWPENLQGVKLGLPKQAWGQGMQDSVRAHVSHAVEVLKSLGAEVRDVDLPYADEALAVYYILMPCEVSSNLARFDGLRYGVRESAPSLQETYEQSRGQGFGVEVRRRIMLGTYALSKGYYDAYYRQARKVQTLIRRAYAKVFQEVDFLVTPTTLSTAFALGEKINDPLTMYLEDIYTVGVNVSGVPALSLPCGLHEGLPVGLQTIGPHWADERLLGVGHAFEMATRA